MRKLFLFVSILFAASIFFRANAQVSEGGTPPSFNKSIDYDFDAIDFPKVDVVSLLAEDAQYDKNGGPLRFGSLVPVNLNIENSGTWTDLDDGGRIWRLKISSKAAFGLGVYYRKFFIPQGGKFFLYNQEKTHVIGAFNHTNNPKGEEWATEIISGDVVILEYYEPAGLKDLPVIDISDISYVYKNVTFLQLDQNKINNTGGCHVNVNCSPEGDDWQDEKKGVARIAIVSGGSNYLCSGSLINNTAQDCTPYFLSANHCGEGSTTAEFNQWIFYFLFEGPACANPNSLPSTYRTATGATKRASAANNIGSKSDMLLLELNALPISAAAVWGIYYNGWNRSTTASPSGVGIHHPGGDLKKIATYTSTLANFYNTHWEVYWVQTDNGWCVTEGGSSGSPIFDNNGYIVGTLTGGYSACSIDSAGAGTGPDKSDWFGKFSYHWASNGSANASKLQPWLDPISSGQTTLTGKYATCMTAGFTADATTITEGQTVTFSDQSAVNPTSWLWTFFGGEPASSIEQNPVVVYNTPGDYTVELTASNASESDTETKIAYIHVDTLPLIADFEANPTTIIEGSSVNFTDLSTGPNPLTSWVWAFENGTPATSNDQNPVVLYTSPGIFDVTLTVSDGIQTSTITKITYIQVDSLPILADFVADLLVINEGESVNFTDLSTGPVDSWNWTFAGGSPATSTTQNPTITYSTAGTYTVSLVVYDSVYSSTETKTAYITVLVYNAPSCDSLTNFSGEASLYSSDAGGYVSGNNSLSDISKAEYFADPSPLVSIDKAYIAFAYVSGTTGSITVNLRGDSNGIPGSVLTSASVSLAQIGSDVANAYLTEANFYPNVDPGGPFYVEVVLPTHTGDTVAIITNTDSPSNTNSGWELWSTGVWYPYSSNDAWGLSLNHMIYTIACPWSAGIDDYNILPNIVNVYPNPSTGQVFIDLGANETDNTTIHVYDLFGKTIENVNDQSISSNLVLLELTNVANGMYLISIETDSGRVVKRITIAR